jgi:hypothetical protein
MLALAAGAVTIAVFVAANAHLVMVSFASAPGCAAVMTVDGEAIPFRAADTSC